MLRLKHVPSPPCGPVGASYETSAGLGGGRPDKAALLFSALARLDLLTCGLAAGLRRAGDPCGGGECVL